MLQHLFVWAIVFIISMIGGLLFQSFGINKHNDSFLFITISGFCLSIVYAQIYSLFLPLKSCFVLGSLLIIYTIIFIIFRNIIINYLKQLNIKNSLIKAFKNKNTYFLILFIIVVGVLLLIKTTQMPFDDDDYLYHAQAVKWYEEFGTVKGAGLINSRYGFNPTTFLAYAMYGFADIFGETMHSLTGYIGFISALGSMIEIYKNKNNYAACGLFVELYYLTCVNQNISSLNTDIIPNILVCCVIILWLEYRNDYNHADLSMIIVLVVTMKLSYAFIGILVLLPVINLFKKKKYKEIVGYVLFALLIAGTYLYRNYLISGWLLYPLYQIDLFDVAWKLPYKETVGQSDWIYAWARIPGKAGIELVGKPFLEWVKVWWSYTATIYVKITIIALIPIFVIYELIYILKKIKKKKVDDIQFLTILVMFVEYVYWQITAPDLRFIFTDIYLLITIILTSLPFVKKIINYVFNGKLMVLFVLLCLLFFAYKINIFNDEILLLKQHTYDKYAYELDEFIFENGIKMYYSSNSYLPGIVNFPAAEYKSYLDRIKPLGDCIRDGFVLK